MLKKGSHHLDFTGRKLRILRSFDPGCDLTGDLDHVFISQRVRDGGSLWAFLWPEDDLGSPFPISEINEDDASMIAGGIDPAG